MKLEKFLNRTSVRDFTNEKMSHEEMKLIVEVINNSPTSTNSQQFSAIFITDQKIKDFISHHNWGQKHISESAAFIVFVADKSRINYFLKKENIIPTDDMIKHDWFRGVVDATIAATYTQDALMELGYGVTKVGGIIGFGHELSKMLNLPKSCFPVLGLSFGKPSKINSLKPKMNKVFFDKYDQEASIKEAIRYDNETYDYFTNRGSKRYSESNVNANRDGNIGKTFAKSGKYVKKVWDEYK